MSRGVIPTHAGDDSDGKIWGIEGINILFLLASGMIGLGLALMLSHRHDPATCVVIGALPFAVTALYWSAPVFRTRCYERLGCVVGV